MRIVGLLAILFLLLPIQGFSSELLPVLSSPNEVMQQGKPWALELKVTNRGKVETFSPRVTPHLFLAWSQDFLIHDSRGQRVPFWHRARLSVPRPENFVLLKPGDEVSVTLAMTSDKVMRDPPPGTPRCQSLEHCLASSNLALPSDTYRLRWKHANPPWQFAEGMPSGAENPFTDPTDRAKVWNMEVWSNTLIIQTTEKEPVKVGLDVDPDTLNFKSEGKWITAYLSTGTKLDLLTSTTRFMGTVASDKIEWSSGQVNEWKAVIKFPRGQVVELLREIRGRELDGFMKVFVSAESGGKMFWGDDKIRILEDPGNAPITPPAQPPANKPSTPPGQDKKKSHR